MPRLSRRAVLLLGLVIGLAIWLVPAQLFGQPEPWDSSGPIYPLALLGSGLFLGFLGPGRTGAAVAGAFAGQFLVLVGRVVANPASSELWVVSAFLLAGYTFVVTGIGALLGSMVRRRLAPDPEPDRRISDRRI